MKRLLRLALLLPTAALAQSVTPPPAAHGFDPARLSRIDSFLQQYVDSGRVAGVVALVLRDGAVVYERAVGFADREAGRRMTPTSMFRIASQSKALTSVAVMMLVEEGKIALTDPVSRFIPQFAHTTVAVTADSVVAARHPITIRELLTLAFEAAGFDDWAPYVGSDPRFERPAEVDVLIGDATKAREKLGWEPKVDFPSLVRMMVEADMAAEEAREHH